VAQRVSPELGFAPPSSFGCCLGFHGGLWLLSWSECIAVVAAPASGGGTTVVGSLQ